MTAVASAARWALGGLYFACAAVILLLAWPLAGVRRSEPLLRALARGLIRLAGARVEVRREAGCDDRRVGVVVSNHVNIFDAFVLLACLPSQRFHRGLELEDHFRYPVYGRLARLAGNVPVPIVKGPADLRRMWVAAGEALRAGTSIAVMPEGGRTLDGLLKPFRDGAFRLAQRFAVPVYPVTISGAFEWNRRGSRLLKGARVVVTLHAPLETAGLSEADVPALRDRARAIIGRDLFRDAPDSR